MKMRWLAPLLLGFLLVGCGQKGDLYLPKEPAQQSSKQQQSQP